VTFSRGELLKPPALAKHHRVLGVSGLRCLEAESDETKDSNGWQRYDRPSGFLAARGQDPSFVDDRFQALS